ncbi:MAG: lipopolysaccharide core heptose(I) kinase RfaP [Gammaproteobacteria bacterium]|nr:lipopolysaccharide core heptose(I) kinase RfaP [Gammaproteobacteria bacterium]
MKFAFCLYKYFPYSGLSRDFLRIVLSCQERGHDLTVFATEWQGERPDSVNIHLLPVRRWMNHAQNAAFYRKLQSILEQDAYDAVVGFNKMPSLDIYYGADYCYVGRTAPRHSLLYRLTPRYHHFCSFERAVFSHKSTTGILSLSEREKTVYQQYYGTPDRRFFLLPPTLDRCRRRSGRCDQTRLKMRQALGVDRNDYVLLFVGSGFKTKGLDRAISALASLPRHMRDRAHLLVVGQDHAALFRRYARRLGVAANVRFLGGRSDIPELLRAGDLLIHPAYSENTGTVLLEAITSGLPVLATDVCGYAPHIERANAGRVLSSPFSQDALDKELVEMLASSEWEAWSRNGLDYGCKPELYAMPESAVEVIEQWAQAKASDKHNHVAQQRRGDITTMYLTGEFQQQVNGGDKFEDLMSITGEVYREAPGRRTLRFVRGGKAYFLKAHTGVGWKEIMKNLLYFRPPVLGAENEWHGIHRLQRLNIDTMHVAGYGVSGKNPARRRSFIITEELSRTVSLEDYCAQWRRRPPRTPAQVEFKRWVIGKVAEIARQIHSNGANHRDFYLCHFLLSTEPSFDSPEPERSKLYLIDLHRMQLRGQTPTRWLVKDVSGLYYSTMDIGLTRRDLFRFMCAYRGKPLREILATEKRFWKRVRTRGLNLYAAEQRRAQRNIVQKARTTISSSFGQ